MTIISKSYGHEIYWDDAIDWWRFMDTDEIMTRDRPCPHCGDPPTPEGYDACIGFIPGVRAACCGHGNPEEAYVIYKWYYLPHLIDRLLAWCSLLLFVVGLVWLWLEKGGCAETEKYIAALEEELSMMRHHWTSPEEVGKLSKELEDVSFENDRLLAENDEPETLCRRCTKELSLERSNLLSKIRDIKR